MANHLGANPVKGGRPPNERRRSGIMSWIIGESLIILFILILVSMEDILRRIKIGITIST